MDSKFNGPGDVVIYDDIEAPLIPERCRAMIQTGVRRGLQCLNPKHPDNDGFCRMHHGKRLSNPRRLLDCIIQ